jgi:hypothetical protein
LSLPLLLVLGASELTNKDTRSGTSRAVDDAKTTSQPRQGASSLASAKIAKVSKRRTTSMAASNHPADTRAINAVALLGLGLASLSAPAR